MVSAVSPMSSPGAQPCARMPRFACTVTWCLERMKATRSAYSSGLARSPSGTDLIALLAVPPASPRVCANSASYMMASKVRIAQAAGKRTATSWYVFIVSSVRPLAALLMSSIVRNAVP